MNKTHFISFYCQPDRKIPIVFYAFPIRLVTNFSSDFHCSFLKSTIDVLVVCGEELFTPSSMMQLSPHEGVLPLSSSLSS